MLSPEQLLEREKFVASEFARRISNQLEIWKIEAEHLNKVHPALTQIGIMVNKTPFKVGKGDNGSQYRKKELKFRAIDRMRSRFHDYFAQEFYKLENLVFEAESKLGLSPSPTWRIGVFSKEGMEETISLVRKFMLQLEKIAREGLENANT